ncbi:MAG: carboxymuconolactone decarboxylase family protein [Gammaproteobacteria bacterium]|nr:carboxymuconolactone decarboxylase family protein [Gammaproteobacteria bacterium]MBI5616256.1 carboxymuconolactone decarboxylase family protein [Gammaproteobacteria bacterium]
MTFRHLAAPRPADEAARRAALAIGRMGGALAPVLLLHAGIPGTLPALWAYCRATLHGSLLPRTSKEIAAAAIASANRCPWSFDAHLVALVAGGARRSAEALVRGDYEALGDSGHRACAEWGALTLEAGNPALLAAPCPGAARAELLGTAVLAHHLDRLATVFLAGSPVPGPEALRPLALGLAGLRHAGAWRRAARATAEPAAIAGTADGAPAWSTAAPAIGAAFVALSNALEHAGGRVLAEPVVSRVHDYVSSWDGEAPSINRHWADRPFQPLGASELAAGRFALLTALAPQQVDAMVVGEFRRHHADETTLVEVAAWAAFTAAQRIGAWLGTAAQLRSA